MYIPVEDKVVNIACEHLEPVQPEKHDKVCTVRTAMVYFPPTPTATVCSLTLPPIHAR